MREVELKAVVGDVDAARARVTAAGGVLRFAGEQLDRRYDTATRALAARDEVLRLRVERGGAGDVRATLDFKGAASFPQGYKVREETSTGVADPGALHSILSGAGFTVSRETERSIETYDLGGAIVRFERYPRMDTLVEVEGDPAQIERAIMTLAIPRDAFTADPLIAFIARFERRTGERALMSRRELEGGHHDGGVDD